jgi:uncharacterized surface anchored protein
VLTESLAPLGYNIATPIEFTVGEDGLVGGEKVEMVNTSNTVKNMYSYDISIDKTWTDGRGNTVEGPNGVSVTFTLQYYDRINNTWVDYVSNNSVLTATLTEDAKVAVFEGLPGEIDGAVARYRAVETKVPGYHQATSSVTVVSDGYGVMHATNIPEVPGEEAFEVLISKNSLGGSEIAGAHIIVTDSQGNTVENGDWISTTEAHQLTLKPGSYTMIETVAPKGYKQVTTAITFVVDNEGHVTLGTTTVDNGGKISVMDANHVILEDAPEDDVIKHEVKISKTDLGGTEIEGAKIVLKDAAGNVIDEWESTTKAHVVMLPEGTYTMIETVAPEGYNKVTTEMTFTVDKDGKVTLLTTKVDNGGEIEVLNGNHVVLKDAPETVPEKETKTPATERKETPKTPVTTRRAGNPYTSTSTSTATSTGDSNGTVMWIVIAAAAAAAIAGLGVMVSRKRRQD